MAKAVAQKAEKPKTKSEILTALAEETGLAKRDVQMVVDALTGLIESELGKKGPGVFTLPGLLKIRRVRKEATKARPGINPFTREPITIKAKPAHNTVKVTALKGLKEMVGVASSGKKK